MNRNELINRMAESNDIASKAEAGRTLDLIINTIATTIASGEEVYLGQDFGGFKPAIQAARSGNNTLTGGTYDSPAKQVIKYKPSSKIKDLVAAK